MSDDSLAEQPEKPVEKTTRIITITGLDGKPMRMRVEREFEFQARRYGLLVEAGGRHTTIMRIEGDDLVDCEDNVEYTQVVSFYQSQAGGVIICPRCFNPQFGGLLHSSADMCISALAQAYHAHTRIIRAILTQLPGIDYQKFLADAGFELPTAAPAGDVVAFRRPD